MNSNKLTQEERDDLLMLTIAVAEFLVVIISVAVRPANYESGTLQEEVVKFTQKIINFLESHE